MEVDTGAKLCPWHSRSKLPPLAKSKLYSLSMKLTYLTLLSLALISCKQEKPPEIGEIDESMPASEGGIAVEHAGMVLIPGGTYTRGSADDSGNKEMYPEEFPAHEVTIAPFYMDEHEVTNAEFLKFVEATGFKTQAERGWSSKDFPKAPPESLKPGALVFSSPNQHVETRVQDAVWQWWKFVENANWRQPTGPGSDISQKMDHPVVCVTWQDAQAYAKWVGKRLPAEAEWERAARGGLDQNTYVWGNEFQTDPGQWPANIFTGDFPENDTGLDGFAGSAPVKSFPPNGYGLYDMAGNVWEHCQDFYRPDAFDYYIATGQVPPTGVSEPMIGEFLNYGRWSKTEPDELSKLHVAKGGSFLCHYTYCLRYRPAARHYSESLAPANHTGFRCAISQ
ncbi:formylglycine-generating enzyme family protein [Akkermansiaceae bacterium]|nr:formylglycine-generating enzyme family protein [Akkermansiaceae bacterium]MDB4578017.1 formylglycine-generating enzyme family protein [Akkermansiaceae bacterium]